MSGEKKGEKSRVSGQGRGRKRRGKREREREKRREQTAFASYYVGRSPI